MSRFSPDDEKRLVGLLGQELVIVRQIFGLTQKQAELLADGDMDALGLVLDDLQALIEKNKGLHQELDVLMQSYLSAEKSPGGGGISAIDAASAAIRAELIKCAEQNDKNIAAAKEKSEECSKQIGKLDLGRKSLGAYVQGVPNTPEMFDKTT